jgi:hypothetical protein
MPKKTNYQKSDPIKKILVAELAGMKSGGGKKGMAYNNWEKR